MDTKINKQLINHANYINKQYSNKRITKKEYDIFYKFIKNIHTDIENIINYVSEIETANLELSLGILNHKHNQNVLYMDLKNKGFFLKKWHSFFTELILKYNYNLNKFNKKLPKEFICILKKDIKEVKDKYYYQKVNN